MIRRLRTTLLASCLLFLSVACSTFGRKEWHSENLGPSEERVAGLTRKEFYAKYPPSGTPMANPPHLAWILGAATYSYHLELQRLEDGQFVEVLYLLQDINDYPASDLHPKNNKKVLARIFDVNPSPMEDPVEQVWIESAENPADIVYLVSQIHEAELNGDSGIPFPPPISLQCGMPHHVLLNFKP